MSRLRTKLGAAILMLALVMLMSPMTSASATATTPADDVGEPVAPEPPNVPDPWDNAQPLGSRWIDIYTTDGGTRGGRYYGTLTWYGNAPYYGEVIGEVEDRDADGYCTVLDVAHDGVRYSLVNQRACPQGHTRAIYHRYVNTHIVKVRVCRYKEGFLYDCSKWS